MANQVKMKGVYGKPLAKAVGQTLSLSPNQMKLAGEIILDSIKKEINRDIALILAVRPAGQPVSLPKTARFAESFKVIVTGSLINITSDWPTAVAHTTDADQMDVESDTKPQPSAPIPMIWLTRPAVPYARIVRSDGEVIVRTTPDPRQGDKPWIHPGFKKYTFLERGIRKGRKLAIEELAASILENLLKTHDLF